MIRLAVVLGLVLVAALPAWGQQQTSVAPPCRELLECQLRVLDLREAREWAEAEVARVKALYATQTRALADKEAEVKRLKDAPREPSK